MDVKELVNELKGEFSSVVKEQLDSVLEDRLKTAIGGERAGMVREIVEELRTERAVLGYDKTGLTKEQKKSFAEMVKNVVIPSTKANEALIPEQDSRGGYLVPAEVANAILRIAASVGVVMSQAAKWVMNSDELNVPSYAGSILEGEYLDVDAAGNVTGLTFKSAKLLKKNWQLAFVVSRDLMAEATPELGEWLLALAGEAMANMIDKQGFAGTGNPFVGILNSDDVTTQTLATGKNTFEEYAVVDDSSDVIAQVEESVLDGSAFFMHRTVWAKLRAQKDTAGNYLLPQAGLVSMQKNGGGPRPAGEILGFPVYTVRHLPAIAASGASKDFLVFGNLRALAFGSGGEMTMDKYTSGSFGGKEIALARQSGIVMGNRHALAIALPAALVKVKTAAS